MRKTIVALLGLLMVGCSSNVDVSVEERLREQLVDAQPGDVIEIPAGTFSFDRGLSLTSDGVTIRGQGMDKTILSFAEQVAGAEGLLVTASYFTIEDLAIEDTKGDGLKVNEGDNITIRRVRVEWNGEPKTENGAYGIYPVQTTNVLVEDTITRGASDAGLYVGQSKDVIVRRNLAEFNVAGIEIENTIRADVYENIATNNTGGILVFNMPQLMQEGKATRVFNNRVFSNNTRNFGHPGTPVASVPAGTGVIVNSNDDVEIFENEIKDHKTANIIISSLYMTGYADSTQSSSFDAYPEGIFIYNNEISNSGTAPDNENLEMARKLIFGEDGRLPDIVWDGFFDKKKLVNGHMPDALKICVDNGEVGVLNVNGPSDFTQPSLDKRPFLCTLEKLPPVDLGRS